MANSPTPRLQNEVFGGRTLGSYLLEYSSALHRVLSQVDPSRLDAGLELVRSTHLDGKRVFVAGNGGSAAIGEHLCCDWTMGTDQKDYKAIQSYSLASNLSLFTALSNDVGYEKAFSEQTRLLLQEGDLLVAISSSGNSKNILNAVEAAKKQKVRTLGLTGFSGGELAQSVDVNIHVNFPNYGLVEDAHQMIMHCFAQFIKRERSAGKTAF